MTHVPRDTHVTKQRMAMRSNFPWSDFKKLGAPELSSSSSTSTALSLKNFEKRAHPSTELMFKNEELSVLTLAVTNVQECNKNIFSETIFKVKQYLNLIA